MVAGHDGFYRQAALPGYCEDVFYNKRTTHYARYHCDKGIGNGNKRITEGMAHYGLNLGQALGARKQQIFRRNIFYQFTAQIPCYCSYRAESQRNDGQHQRVELLRKRGGVRVVKRREPFQLKC